jgi:hypothetical protein
MLFSEKADAQHPKISLSTSLEQADNPIIEN